MIFGSFVFVSSQRTEKSPNGVLELSKKYKEGSYLPEKKNFWGDESSFGTDGWICKKKKEAERPKSAEGRVYGLADANGRNGWGCFFPRGHITTENDRESPPPELDS